jgi:hypothetical protein
MFYDTRNGYIENSDPSNSPNTDLREIPEKVEIDFGDVQQEVDCEEWDSRTSRGWRAGQFVIGRAMLDPDATVKPI